MNLKASLFFLLLVFVVCQSSLAQISPPGVDGAKIVGWGAVGISQQLTKKFSVTVYAGGSRQSDPDNLNPVRKASIFVINQETLYSFNTHWQLALCTSVRIQDLYADDEPYALDNPGIRDELRYYARLYYKRQGKKIQWTYSFRPEFRTFYTKDWREWSTPLEIRLRLKGQANIPLNKSKSNQLILANEVLSAIDHYQRATEAHDEWSSYHFTEDRFSNYFRHAFKKPSIIVDAGLMHQFLIDKRNSDVHYTLYLAFDVLIQNPFGRLKE